MSEHQACCAHLNVLYVRVDHKDGTCSNSWQCRDCKMPFWPRVAAQPAPRSGGEPLCATDKESQRQIDVINLRLYARLARENEWADDVIHWSVFEQTLNAIADRIEHPTPAPDAAGERWISVEERLPDIVREWQDGPNHYGESKVVLIFTGHIQLTGFYYKSGTWSDFWGSVVKPTHWRPLPEPPAPQPPEKAGAVTKLMVNHSGVIHEASPDCRGVCSEYEPPPPPQGPGREGDSEFQNLLRYAYILSELPEVKMSDALSVSLPTLRRWMKGESLPHEAMRPSIITKIRQMLKTASHPVEGKARPSCPICNETDITIYEHAGEFFLHCSDNQTHPAWKVVSAESFAQFFRPTLPDAEELAKTIEQAVHSDLKERGGWNSFSVRQIISASLRSLVENGKEGR